MQREMCEEKDERFSGPLLDGKDEGIQTRKLDEDAIAGADVARARWTLLRQVNTSSI